MPNARVGAMPHAQAGKKTGQATKKNRKDGRKKGITMEDLKQQTADRLAKEQRRRNAAANRASRRNAHGHDPSQVNLVQSSSIETTVSCDNSVSSSSFHNPSPHIVAAQRSVDDFPHGRFDFVRKDHVKRSVVGQQQQQQQQQHVDVYQSPGVQGQPQQQQQQQQSQKQQQQQQQQRYHTHQSPQNFTPQKYKQGHIVASVGKYSSQTNHFNSGRSVGSGSASSKLPHGLTVQELKEMTRARLAAEAAEAKETPIKSAESGDGVDSLSQSYSMYGSTSSQPTGTRLYSHESRAAGGAGGAADNTSIGCRMLSASDSFGSLGGIERQRLGSMESFGSARSAYNSSTYHAAKGLLSPSLSQDQPPLTSFSYEMDNESYTSAIGSESFFGSETHCSKTTKYSTNSSVYRIPYSVEKSSPASNSTKVTANNGRGQQQQALWNDPFARSSSPVPTIANSTTSGFGHSENDNASFFNNTSPLGKMDRLIAAGAVVPNSVAESVLGTSDDNLVLERQLSGLYGGGGGDSSNQHSPSAFVSPEVQRPSSDGNITTYTSPWSNPKERYNDDGEVDDGIAKLQSEWNAFLNIDSKDPSSSADDFPLSTFISKSKDNNTSYQSNQQQASQHLSQPPYFSSPFQTVPEERVVQNNLMSRDVNVPERFIDEPAEEVTGGAPKIGNMMRRKKSRS